MCKFNELAVRIEERAVELYRRMREMTTDEQIRRTVEGILQTEEHHLRAMQEMICPASLPESPLKQVPESQRFMDGIAARMVLVLDKIAEHLDGQDVCGALTRFIELEMDMILFYTHIAHYAAATVKSELIDSIVGDERKHWASLSELKQKLAAS
ncbi:MAG: hypothetical protein NC924_07915 [Candidatus Omnitrophica bacterium]|nr:hypothetical protein [Candidatus Omnitrophota bacterium]